MTYIIWDEELATKAQNWASNNEYGHNPDTTIPSGRFSVGENIYMYSTTAKNFNFDPDLAMKFWWDEYVDYTYSKMSMNDFMKPKQIGHYTQMAWATSTRLGCGISRFYETGDTKFFVVCNYGPAGNFIGQTPYNPGKSISDLVCGESDCKRKYGKSC